MNYLGISNNPLIRSTTFPPFATVDKVFSDDEIDTICKTMATREKGKGLVQHGSKTQQEDPGRKSNIVMEHYGNPETSWIFHRINDLVMDFNTQNYNFDLNGYDRIQYGEYNSTYEGKYDWHMDLLISSQHKTTVDTFETRKLSVSIMLNEPSVDFEGGEFEFNMFNQEDPTAVFLKKGSAVLFPSFLLHRVKKVTKGIRKSLVVWVCGPKFR